MSINNGTINALIQLNGGVYDSTKQLEEREPYITSDYYMYVGRGVEGNLPIEPIKVRQADSAFVAATLNTSLATGSAIEEAVRISSDAIYVGSSITIHSRAIIADPTGSATIQGFNIMSNSIRPASGTGTISKMNLSEIKRIQLVKGQSYGTEAEKNALTDVQVGQLFFVVG